MKTVSSIFFKEFDCRRKAGKGTWLLTVMLCTVLGTGCSSPVARYSAMDTAMGTVVRQSVYARSDKITDGVEEIIDRLEQETLSWRIADSEIARINALAGSGTSVEVSNKLNEDLIILLDVAEKSGGAFDFTIGSVVRLWNIDAWAAGGNVEGSLPTQEEIVQALACTGYEKVSLENGRICLPARMSLDLGSVGKGIACDRIADYLEAQKVQGAVISVGGSILTFGSKPDGSPWQVGIVDPQDTSSLIGTLSLTGQWCVSTSGDYERYVEVEGRRYHHILDPATGYPANSGVHSVTILCKSGILSDALSTACFVLGEEKGMALAESYGAEALFVDMQGKIVMTEGMQGIFKETGEK